MSATSAPFGLRPAFHPSGLDRAQALAGGIASAFNTDIFKGQPVRYNTTAIGGTLCTICPATISGAWVGAFAGVQWTDTTGRARVSNYWPANTAYTAGTCVAYFYNDPNIVYEIQADGTLAQTSIGDEYPFSNVTVGSTTTGLSQCTLNRASPAAADATSQMRVVDIAPYPGNDWGDAFTIVRVVNSQSQFFGSFAAIA